MGIGGGGGVLAVRGVLDVPEMRVGGSVSVLRGFWGTEGGPCDGGGGLPCHGGALGRWSLP